MPVLNRRQPSLDLRKAASARTSMDSDDSRKEALWIVRENVEKSERPQRERDFPTSKASALPSRPRSSHNLRLTTKVDLHDKYQSDEEEASPSPDDDSDSNDESLEDDSITYEVHDPIDVDSHSTSSSLHPDTSSINIATSILFFPPPHRPRLIHITRLAPLQKRKRPPPSSRTHSHKRLTSLDENVAYPGPSSSASTASSYHTADLPLRRENHDPRVTRISQPESWLPMTADEEEQEPEQEQEMVLPGPYKEPEESIYFPEPPTSPTTYAELDPYSLSPPTLIRTFSNTPSTYSPYSTYDRQHSRSSLSSPSGPSERGSGSGSGSGSGWRGKVRGLGLVRKASSDQGGKGSLNQRAGIDSGWGRGKKKDKGKLIARGAAERQEFMGIPPFPFEGVLA
ncbi:MAG: hypothetical protein Q9187_006990 [Circinaria calcarea]